MEDGKKLLHKLADGKKIDKSRCLIVVLAGILLCLIAFPSGQNDTKSGISNIVSDTIDNHSTEESNAGPSESAYESDPYEVYWEKRLENALRYVDGVGQVRVLITLKESAYKIVEKDGPEEFTDTQEADSDGGSRTVSESRLEKSTVYTEDGNGQNVPYVVKTVAPTVEGVVVIAQGASKQGVRDDIIEAIQVLFDIEANNIKIVKMKNNQ